MIPVGLLPLTVFSEKTMDRGFKQSYIKVKSHFYVFLSVLFLKKNMSMDINVTNAQNPEYCNMFNPGSLEQEPRQEQVLTVLLYESSYDC